MNLFPPAYVISYEFYHIPVIRLIHDCTTPVPIAPLHSPSRIANVNNLRSRQIISTSKLLGWNSELVAGAREVGGVDSNLQASKRRRQIRESCSCIPCGMDGLLRGSGVSKSSSVIRVISRAGMSDIEADFWRPRFMGPRPLACGFLAFSGAWASSPGIEALVGDMVPWQLSGAESPEGRLGFSNWQ